MAVRVFSLVVGIMLSLPRLSAQSPDIDVLMQRVGDYVHGFIDRFCNVVAEERYEPTMLRQDKDRDLPARGTVWASERTGTIVKTELRLGSDPTTTTITTIFGRDEPLNIDVPTILEQTYYASPSEVVKGTARYSNFRRFSVSTDEKIDAPER